MPALCGISTCRTLLAPWFKGLCALCCLSIPAVGLSSEPPIVVQGDILTLAPSTTTLTDGPNIQARAISLPSSVQLWPAGIVPFVVHPDLSGGSVAAIEAGVALWNEVSGITLMPVSQWRSLTGSDAQYPDDFVHFQPGSGCASWVGRRGGEQEIWIAPNCNAGSVIHEIGHVLGLEHEHTRPDRDQYIDILWENIDAEKRHNFDIAPTGSRMLGGYDYDSVMHYGPTNFSTNGQPTIIPLTGSVNSIGQRNAPSIGDLAAISDLYSTDLGVVAKLYEQDGRRQLSVQVSNHYPQGAHTIEVSVSDTDGRRMTYQSDDQWRCRYSSDGSARCLLDRLAGNTSSILYVDYPEVSDVADLVVTLQSKTPDDNAQNNLDIAILDPSPTPVSAAATPAPTSVATLGAALVEFLEDSSDASGNTGSSPPLTSASPSSVTLGSGALGHTTALCLLLLLLNRLTGLRIQRLSGRGINRLGIG